MGKYDEYYKRGERPCTKCGEVKPLNEFRWQTESHLPDGGRWSSWCNTCVYAKSAETRRWRGSEGYEARREYSLRSRFNMTLDDYARLLEQQAGGCAICFTTPEQHGKALTVDHDHSCCPGLKSCGECVRGLLCSRCNRALGLLGDDSHHLQRAVVYLGGQ